ncbi:arylsulfatase I [Rhipicephalus sanguineus]|nr:arylsulfatase I [Rhipicephalus sanguineus]
MDRSIGEVLAALQTRGMLVDSVVVFASDNGAAPVKDITASNAGSNWPLRGGKSNVWEGGMRTPAVFWYGRLSGRLPRPPSQQMMHIVDWAPTFYAAAGGDVSALGDVDGRDQWEALSAGKGNGHEDMILEIEGRNEASAIISGRYKLVNRSEALSDPLLDIRMRPPEGDPPMELELDSLMKSSEAWKALQEASRDAGASGSSAPRENWRQELIVKCDGSPTSRDDESVSDNFDPHDTTFVFDIISDPCELNNLASSEPELRDRLLKKLATFRAEVPIDPMTDEVDERSFPEYHHCTWSTWMDVEPADYQSCPC